MVKDIFTSNAGKAENVNIEEADYAIESPMTNLTFCFEGNSLDTPKSTKQSSTQDMDKDKNASTALQSSSFKIPILKLSKGQLFKETRMEGSPASEKIELSHEIPDNESMSFENFLRRRKIQNDLNRSPICRDQNESKMTNFSPIYLKSPSLLKTPAFRNLSRNSEGEEAMSTSFETCSSSNDFDTIFLANNNNLSNEMSPEKANASDFSTGSPVFLSPDHESLMTFFDDGDAEEENMRKSSVTDLLSMNIKAASPMIKRSTTARKRISFDICSQDRTPDRSILAEIKENVHKNRPIINKRCEPIETSPLKDAKRVKCEMTSKIPLITVKVPQEKNSLPQGRPIFRKLMSMNEAALTKNKFEPHALPVRPALRKLMSVDSLFDQADLTGDFNHKLCLPLMTSGMKHPDLKTISADTMRRLLLGEFDDIVASYKIIDCRYPYEFEGGHIRGAINLYTEEQIREEILNSKAELPHVNSSGKRNIYIFHCEFSSERGPRQNRSLRALDRELNKDNYPFLKYPEIYLLHGGYREFFEHCSDLCEPQNYRLMLDEEFREQLEHYRLITKRSGDGLGTVSHRDAKKRMKSRTRLY